MISQSQLPQLVPQSVHSSQRYSLPQMGIFRSDDGDKPPKGFEKFFRKKQQQQEQSSKDDDSEKKSSQSSEEESKDKDKDQEEEKKDDAEDDADDQDKKKKKAKEGSFYDRVQEEFFDQQGNPRPDRWAGIIALFFGYLMYDKLTKRPRKEIVFMNFLNEYLLKNNVKEIKISKDRRAEVFNHKAEIDTVDGQRLYMILHNQEMFLAKLDQVQRQMGKNPNEMVPVKYVNDSEESSTGNTFLNVSLAAMACFAMYQIYKGRNPGGGAKGKQAGKDAKKGSSSNSWLGGGNLMGNMQKSNASVYGEDKKIDIRFKDVAGNENAKQEVLEFVDFLKNPKKYQALGARVPRGALLCGPPGTGKTLLAKAVAGEAGVPFVSTSGSEFVEMFVGVGASRVRDLFKTAREKAPSIIFIDEIDAVGKKRAGRLGGGNEERDNTLNQLLVEMDGFSTDSSVIVLAATNRADSLDSALLRPGRFDRQIEITLPSIKERAQIFNVHLKKIQVDPALSKEDYAKKLSALTPGFSGADIMNICNEGAIIAARKDGENVTIRDFEMATERVIAGIERKLPQSKEERKTVAYHEAGHAVAGWFSKDSAPLIKLTIIPRAKGSLGFAQYLPDELTLYTQEQLEDMITVALGGRIAEEIFFGRITTGASDDLKKCTQIANGIVSVYGMSKELGTLNYEAENQFSKPYSDRTAKIIDDEISRIINERYRACKELLTDKKETIEKLAERLLEKETLSLPDIVDILGPRPFPLKESVQEYLQELKDRQETEDQLRTEEEKQEEEKKKAAAETIKFDPDAAEPAEDDDKETDGKDQDQEKKKDE